MKKEGDDQKPFVTADDLRPIAISNELRFSFPTPLDRAVYLVSNNYCTIRVCAEAMQLWPNSIESAIKAKAQGRAPGVNGRPPNLPAKIQKMLDHWVDERIDSKNYPTSTEVRNKV